MLQREEVFVQYSFHIGRFMRICPCGSDKTYNDCCGKFIMGLAAPTTPEELMRSRYSAYMQADIHYIAQTMKGPAQKNFHPASAQSWAGQVTWLGLEVIRAFEEEGKGYVEFIASFSAQGQKEIIHELSEFHKEAGGWFYVDGTQLKPRPAVAKSQLGRNESCLCGSGKKYKKCCGLF
jgi:SEC-C motif-containing protein